MIYNEVKKWREMKENMNEKEIMMKWNYENNEEIMKKKVIISYIINMCNN